MHRLRRLRHRTNPSAFTLVELAVSLLIFGVIAGVVTVAIGRVQLTMATSRLEREVRAEMASMINQVATNPYPTVATANFIRPEECASDPFKSCIELLGREIEVAWYVVAGADQRTSSEENPYSVELTATSVLPNGKTISVARTIVSPNAGSNGGVVRVRLSGSSYDGPVFLVDGAGDVIASAVADRGTALLLAETDNCTTAVPCRLALSADGGTRNGQVTLDAASVTGARRDVTLSDYAVTEVAAALVPVTPVHVLLEARNGDGTLKRAERRGSVCLWFSFTTAGATNNVPACNTESADRVVLRTYRPDPAQPELEVALPQNVRISVSADAPDGTCPQLPDTVVPAPDGSGWSSDFATCTSRTWGLPSLWRAGTGDGELSAFDRAGFRLSSTATRYFAAIWSAEDRRSFAFAPATLPQAVVFPQSGANVFGSAAGEASVELWFEALGVSARQVLYEEGDSTAGLNVYLFNNRVYAGAWSPAWPAPLGVDSPVTAGTKHHVVAVFDSGEDSLALYLDGQLVDTATKTGGQILDGHNAPSGAGATVANTFFVDLGTGSTAPSPFEGSIDELARYATALDPASVAEHAAASGSAALLDAVLGDEPAAFYRFEELSGVVVHDVSGNGLHAGTSGPGVNAITTTGMWARWTFDEPSGAIVADKSGNGNDLAVGAGVALGSTGKSGSAADFNGSANAYAATMGQIGSPAATIECWVYLTGATAGPCVKVGGGADGYSVGVGNGSYQTAGLQIVGQFGGLRWLPGTATMSTGTWNHLALTVTGSTAKLYLNGVAAGTFTQSAPLTPTPGVYVGRNVGIAPTGQALVGLIDEVSAHTTALDASQIALRAASSPSLPAMGTNAGYPATGYIGETPWAHPRLAENCAQTMSCTPAAAPPELNVCPGSHCFSASNQPPVLRSPRRGIYQIGSVLAVGESVVFALDIDDPDQASDRVTVSIAPGGLPSELVGTLTFGGAPVSVGQTLAAAKTTPLVVPGLQFTPAADWASAKITFRLTDGKSSRDTTVVFSPASNGTYPAQILAGPVQVRQGDTDIVDTFVIGDDGNPLVSATLSSSPLPAGASEEPVLGAGDGWFLRTYQGGTAAAGVSVVNVAANAISSVATRFEVLPAAGTITVDAPDLAQGRSGTMTVTVQDGADAAVSGIGVWVTVSPAAGGSSQGVYAPVSGCVTRADGTCSVTLQAELSAEASEYTVTAISGSASATDSITVSQTASTISINTVTVEQGANETATATVYDGSGTPVRGVRLSAVGTPPGSTVVTSGPTDGYGRSVLTFYVPKSAGVGTYPVSISDGTAAERTINLIVKSTVNTIDTDPISVPQGGAAALTVHAFDPQGNPVEGATLDLSAEAPLVAISAVTTDGAGSATANVSVSRTAELGSYLIPVSYRGQRLGSVSVTVTSGVSSIVGTGAFTRGQATSVTLSFFDAAGNPVTNRPFQLSVDSRLATPSTISGSSSASGQATATLTFSGNVAPGVYTIRVLVDGRWINVGVPVR